MSKLKQKIQKAREKGVFVFNWAAYVKGRPSGTVWAGYVNNKGWAILVDGEWYPRIGLTKREAVNLAYAISVAKRIKLEVKFG